MSAERFTLDTNVLVYAVDSLAGPRHRLARDLVDRAAEANCWLTLQSLSEFYAVVTRKGLVPPAEAAAMVEDWLAIFPTATASAEAVRIALATAVGGRASYWDALLMASAAEAGCATIVTEDLGPGAGLADMRIVAPFDGTRLSAAVEDLLEPSRHPFQE